MTTGQFSPEEWKSLLNAPHWVYAAVIAAERGNIFTRRTEAQALDKFLTGYVTRSPLVKEIIAGQKEADDKLEGSLQDAEKMLGQVGTLLERKASGDEGDAVRDFLMSAAQAIADASREEHYTGSTQISGKEKKTLALIGTALKATEDDKRRRHEAAVASEAEKLAQQKREAEARAEAQKKAEVEAKKKEYEAETKRLVAEEEAKRKAAAAEAEAKRKAAQAEAKKKAAEAEAQKQAAEAAAASAETMRIYVVKPGDTLSGIAKQMYGKAGRWPEIYEANRDIIEKPNLIRPGWKLRIPD